MSHHPSVQLVKFADDTTLTGLIHNSDESEYFEGVADLVSWCDANNLELNASKTKEMVVDFRRNMTPFAPFTIKGVDIERVDTFKFLGTTISSNLGWHSNTATLVRRAQQRLYFLRQLRKFGLRREILRQFYRSTVESILTFSISVWFGGTDQAQRKMLDRVVSHASRTVGEELTPLATIYEARMTTRAKKIVSDPAHPAHHLFQRLPSGRRYRLIKAGTARLRRSFFPSAVSALNSKL